MNPNEKRLLPAPARSCVFVFMFFFCSHASAEEQEPWTRHTIDNTSRGADGVRLGDINGDGLQDIATGWEEGGLVRVYLNPGKDKSKKPWPRVTVGKVKNVEDAVFVDLDNDGTLDVVSSCEGKTKTMYVHWGPKDKKKLLDEKAWETEPIPVTVGKQMWMYCTPMDVDGNGRADLVAGSKGRGAAVGWLESPHNQRDLGAWKYHKIRDAGWIMSLDRYEFAGRSILTVTDRKGASRGLFTLERVKGNWRTLRIELNQAEYMFAHHLSQRKQWSVATRDGSIRLFQQVDNFTAARTGEMFETWLVPNPYGTRNGKAVSMGKIDQDDALDLVVSFNTQGQKNKPGVAWIKALPDKDPKDWPAYNISGLEGKKFDRLELIDMDGDGDLDVLTCEEADNLGVIWYENPYGSSKIE